MQEDAKGSTLAEQEVEVSEQVLGAVGAVLGTPSAPETATLFPYFGATIGGEQTVVAGLGMDLSRSMLAGLEYEWRRPFVLGETIRARVTVSDVYTKGCNQIGVVLAEFTDADGQPVHHQSITFIERQVS